MTRRFAKERRTPIREAAHPIEGEAMAFLAALVLAASPASAAPLDEALQKLRSEDVLIADAAVEDLLAAAAPSPEAARAAGDSLLALLGDARRDVRAGAIRGLGLLPEPRAADPLARLLRASLEKTAPDTFEDRYLRILSIQALGRIGAREPDLLERAAQGDSFERAHAGVALFKIAAPAGEGLVREALADTTLAIRNIAVEGLGEFDSSAARDLVLAATQDASWVVRDTAFRSLRRWAGEPAVQDAWTKGAQDPSWFVRATVAEVASPAPPASGERHP